MKVEPITLAGEGVRLEPLSLAHLDALCAVGLDAELWRWTTAYVMTPEAMRAYVETALEEQRRGVSLPFATIEAITNTVVGSTRFGNIDARNRRVEIGWTWIAPAWQRTRINTAAKYLILRHAFETWNFLRVELKTDTLNQKSRAAILRLGATEEGVFRKHIVCDNGRIRDSVYFSITDDEWAKVKIKLENRLQSN